jgi:DDE superfamily endonuclease
MDESYDDNGTPSGISQNVVTKKRRRFSLQDKMCLVRSIQRKIETERVSIRMACNTANIHHKQYLTWKKEFNVMRDVRNSKAKSICTGRSSILKPFEQDLLKFIFELREQGMGVSKTMVMIKAASISRPFREKSRTAQYNCAKRFVHSHGLVYRMGTHESQTDPRETTALALDFVRSVGPKLMQKCRHQDFIINMDQTPVPFTYNSKKTLELIGRRTVHVRKSTNDTKRATFAMTVTASGKVLKPLLIFKGKRGGRIEKRELTTFPKEILYACQDNAWMDEAAMLLWVEKILKPYILEAPEHIVPILFLDSYRCHMMASVVGAIHELGVEVEHIPGGCTGLAQPVDVGINKPFKNRIRQQWESWMIQEGIIHGTTSPPTREDIAKWSVGAMQTLPERIVKNSWRHGDYSWFPNETNNNNN